MEQSTELEPIRGEFIKRYYTPDIEDIRVGYECEKGVLDFSCHDCKPSEWKPYVFVVPDIREGDFKEFSFGLISSLRTHYLTKEQIEAEGWKITFREFKEPPYQVDWINAEKGEYKLWINLAMHKSMHLGVDKKNHGILFRGKCPSINEFRYICKLLNINK